MNFHQNSLKLLLLLHFSMDSFETRYTYFLGPSPNFVLFRNLKFGFSDILRNQIFIEMLLLLQFPMHFFGSRSTSSSFQFFETFFNTNFHQIFIEIATSYSFQWIPLKLGKLIILWVSLHIFF